MSKSFYPNECYICGVTTNLKRCSRCHLISYCCETHQKQDWISHKTFCDVIYLIMRVNDLSHIYENSKGYSLQKWTSERLNMSGHVSSLLDRDLQPNEIQMLNFPRSCIVCYDTRQNNLTNCPNCPLVSFCKDHPNSSQHDEQCSKIKYCYNFEKNSEQFMEQALTLLYKIVYTPSHTGTSRLPTSVADYLSQTLDPTIKIDDKTKNYLSAIVAPCLTIFNAIQKLNYTPSSRLTISIQTRDSLNNFPQHWEILLHLFPNVKFLKIILDNESNISTEESVSLCEKCTAMKRKLIIKDLSSLDPDSDEFMTMDLSVLFNMSIPKNWDLEWAIISPFWELFNCPLIFTLNKESQMKNLRRKLRTDDKWKRLICYDGYNDFTSTSPCRSLEDWTIVEDKKLLIIVNAVGSNPKNKKIPNTKHEKKSIEKNSSSSSSSSSVKNNISQVKNQKKIKGNNSKKREIKGENSQHDGKSSSSVENNLPLNEEKISDDLNYKEIKSQNGFLLKKNSLLQLQIDDVIKENISLKEENIRLNNEILKLEKN